MSQTVTSFAVEFPGEELSNTTRRIIGDVEPHSLRTFTSSQAVLASSAGIYHWTPEGRRLVDFTSGVLVANLGHNPISWLKRFYAYLGWPSNQEQLAEAEGPFLKATTLTAYNAVTPLEADATRRLLKNLQSRPGGSRLQTVNWAASGSEAVQKALWACMRRDSTRPGVMATRFGFHGKKGLSEAVTGSETDRERDPRVRFISFPREECSDIREPAKVFHPQFYRDELQQVLESAEHPIGCLITEPYLGGGGSFHPPRQYMQLLQDFCRQHDILFILDEVQANFGRTGQMYAFETYGIEPDFVCLGKGLGNGVPVSAAVGRRDVCELMGYGETSDTWSANPLSCAAVLATLDEFETTDVLEQLPHLSALLTEGLLQLKATGAIVNVRGEGMVYGLECGPVGTSTARDVANAIVERCYRGNQHGEGIHLLGPLAGCVLRISPPMCMTDQQARDSLALLKEMINDVVIELSRGS
ncbi:MAG: aspartate aminotransferase family protein [Planctomycetaceae bacterium]